MASKYQPYINTKTDTQSLTILNNFPVPALINPNGQLVVHAEHTLNSTAGETPKILCHMKDGTWAYIPQDQLVNTGVFVKI
jgi:hypothetical protein